MSYKRSLRINETNGCLNLNMGMKNTEMLFLCVFVSGHDHVKEEEDGGFEHNSPWVCSSPEPAQGHLSTDRLCCCENIPPLKISHELIRFREYMLILSEITS